MSKVFGTLKILRLQRFPIWLITHYTTSVYFVLFSVIPSPSPRKSYTASNGELLHTKNRCCIDDNNNTAHHHVPIPVSTR